MKLNQFLFFFVLIICFNSCSKKSEGDNITTPPITPPATFSLNNLTVNGIFNGYTYTGANLKPIIKVSFLKPLNIGTVAASVIFMSSTGAMVIYAPVYQNNDSAFVITPATNLQPLTNYTLTVSTQLKATDGATLQSAVSVNLFTGIDSSDKFPVITDDALLTKVQEQTFKYFWDFAHPVSGLARERNTSGDIVTSGGSGFGIMAIPVGINRNFITRAQGVAQMQKIVAFLKNTAVTVKGAYPHWLNGATGAIVPFSANDNGADLVETSYLMMGLLTARQYFTGADAAETALRNDINTIYNRVEWDWFRKGGENVLYWHYSNDKLWTMNVKIQGYNECLITYIMAAASITHTIPKIVYDAGWANNGGMKNNNSFYGYQLPLGPNLGGPLFFEQYTYLGVNPNGLNDTYANYQTQVVNHTKINYEYCKANPKAWYGYGASCWGLTASDISGGYTASSPSNDVGVIAPTAALSSMPYTPTESMAALKFFYYKLGDKLWGNYGFYDAFKLHDGWFASSTLAIDQGPIIGMIENYRTQLLWNLFTSAPEVKAGMTKLGFTAPYL